MIGFFARHPTAANLLMAVFIVAGIINLWQLRRETFPDITPTKVEVRIIHPGATAEDVEETLCRRVEDAIDGINFVKEIVADARESSAVVTVEMEDGGNIQTFLDDVQTEVNAIDDFPEDAEKPIIRLLGRTEPVLSVLVSGPMTATDLKAYCEDLKKRLKRQTDVSLVEVAGFSDRQFRIEMSRAALRRFELSVADVADRISKQSINLPAGGIETREQELLIRFVEERRSIAELEDLIIIEGPAGSEVR